MMLSRIVSVVACVFLVLLSDQPAFAKTPSNIAPLPLTKKSTQFRGANIHSGLNTDQQFDEVFNSVATDYNTNLVRWQIHWGDKIDRWPAHSTIDLYQRVWDDVSAYPDRIIKGSDTIKTLPEINTLNIDAYMRWLDWELVLLDSILGRALKTNQYVVIDLHTPPGYRESRYGGGRFLYFEDSTKYQDALVKVWNTIASRYKTLKPQYRKVIWGYDIVNEPLQDGNKDGTIDVWYKVTRRVAQEIYRIDPEMRIIVEPYWGAAPCAFDNLVPIDVPNITYSVHFYNPFTLTHNFDDKKAYHYPGPISESGFAYWDKSSLLSVLASVRKFQQKYSVPIFVGEFSIRNDRPGNSGYNYLKDAIEIFEDFGWDWCYHAIRESEIWSPDSGYDVNPANNVSLRRIDILKRYFSRNRKPTW